MDTVLRFWYDCLAGILDILKKENGFTKLLAARQEAKERHENLHDFFLFSGLFWLNNCGDFTIVNKGHLSNESFVVKEMKEWKWWSEIAEDERGRLRSAYTRSFTLPEAQCEKGETEWDAHIRVINELAPALFTDKKNFISSKIFITQIENLSSVAKELGKHLFNLSDTAIEEGLYQLALNE